MTIRRVLYILIYALTAMAFNKYTVYWNVPTRVCYKHNISLPLDEFGVVHNSDLQFKGDMIVLFYEKDFPFYPFYKRNGSDFIPISGGIPQRCDFHAHIDSTKQLIMDQIPDKNFNGLAIIDFEAWRPLYEMNWGTKRIYQKKSIDYVMERYPEISRKAAEYFGALEFDIAAKRIFRDTIKIARKMRPNAQWGYYAFPYCNYDAGNSNTVICSERYRTYNDKLVYLTSAGTALFPSIYFHRNQPVLNYRYAQAVLNESLRVRSLDSESNRAYPMSIYPYSKFEYDPYNHLSSFYSKKDICGSAKLSADMGLQGLILWSTSDRMKERCNLISDHLKSILGPRLQMIRKRSIRCSRRHCSGHGICVRTLLQDKCTFQMRDEHYTCRCEPGFTGNQCQIGMHLYLGSKWHSEFGAYKWSPVRSKQPYRDREEHQLLALPNSNIATEFNIL